MESQYSNSVIDLHPWPTGLGFQDASTWWDYVHSRKEEEKLELLMLLALLSEEVCRLLFTHDSTLVEAFRLSPQSAALLSEIDANTLAAFGAALELKREQFSAQGKTNP